MITSIYNPKQGNAHSTIAQQQKSQKSVKKTRLSLYYLLVLLFVFGTTTSWGQSLLLQDFNFSGNLTSNGWVGHSGVGTNPIATTTGLTYTGFVSSGIGNAALVKNLGGEDDNITFANQNTNGQSVYYSCMINITDPATSKSGDYFIHLGTPGGATFTLFAARVFAKITAGAVNFGISNLSTGITYGTTPFARNTTYLLVVKYTINTGGSDPTSLWIIPSGIPATEALAGTPEFSIATTAGQDAINTIALRQGSATASPQVVIDGIQVGTTWESVTHTSFPILAISGNTAHPTLCVGTPGTGIVYTINNSGGVANVVSVVSNNSQFVVSGAPTTVAANGSANFTVVFTPSGGGPQGANITVSSTTPGSNSPFISLTGIGTATVAPVVSSDPANGITSNSATINGNISTLGVCPSTTEKGFVYSTTSVNNNPLVGGSGVTKQSVGGLATGAFGLGLTGLSPSTSYTYKAYVYDNTNYTYSTVTAFATDAPPAAFITTTGTLSAVNTVYGTASPTPTSFTVSGNNLTDDITIEAPIGYEISSGGAYVGSITLTQTGGVVNSTTINVRLTETSPVGSYSGDIVLSSSGSNDPVVATALSTVSPKALTVPNAVAIDKVYDGNNAAVITGTLSGVIAPDVVTFIGTGTFASINVNVGPAIAVTSTSTIGGANAANYSLTPLTGLSANITKANQTITFNQPAAKTFGNAPFALNGTSDAGLTVAFSNPDPSIATISGSTVTIVGAGSTVITASQVGDGNHFAATNVLQTLVINKAAQTIFFGALVNKLPTDPAFVLHATTSAGGLPVIFASATPTVATISNDTVVNITGIGTSVITASQAGNSNYLAAANVLQTLTVITPPIIAWQLNGKLGTEVTVNATTNDANLSTSTLSRTGVTSTALNNAYSSTGYPVSETRAAAISAGRGQRFTISAAANYAVSLSTLDAKFRRSAQGPNLFVWQYSLNGTTFTDIGTDISYNVATTNGDAQTQINLAGIAALQNVASGTTITIRIIGWGATATTGTFAIGRSTTTGTGDFSLSIGGSTAFVQSITTNAVSGSPFCVTANDSTDVDVAFTSTGSFNSGNVFTAQLSNSTGFFILPTTDIGILSSTANTGIIHAKIPAGTAQGTGYRIRVVSTTPSIIGSTNGSNLTVNLVSNSIALSHIATAPLCFGGADGAIDLSVLGGQSPYSYSWSNGAISQDISNINSAVYTVTVTDVLGCTKRDTTHVPQPLELQVTTVPMDATCAGAADGGINLTVTGGTQPYTYAWSNDFGTTTFATTEDITNQPANFYIVNVLDAHGCASGALDIINEPIPLQITSFTPTSGASGTSVVISGSGLTPVTNVKFNNTAATFIVVTDGEIDATVASGTTTGPITITALPGCALTTAGNFTITGAGVNLTVKILIEGIYAGGGMMTSPLFNSDNSYPDPTIADSVTIELHDVADPSITVFSQSTRFHLDGNSEALALPNALLGNDYYLSVRNRNSIETWSKLPVSIGTNTNFDFTQ